MSFEKCTVRLFANSRDSAMCLFILASWSCPSRFVRRAFVSVSIAFDAFVPVVSTRFVGYPTPNVLGREVGWTGPYPCLHYPSIRSHPKRPRKGFAIANDRNDLVMDLTNATPDSQLDKQTQEEACPPACLFNGVVAGASSYVLGLAFGFGA